jgi:hypothetical protein
MIFGIVELLLLFVVLGGLLVLFIFFYKNIQDLMYEVAPHNQQVPPTNIWLMFIPLFNLVYGFIIYPKIADSVRFELEERDHSQPGDYGRGLGVTLPILRVCQIIPILKYLAFVGWLIVLIVYWVKMAEFKKALRSLPAVSASGAGVKFNASNDLLD